MISKFLAGIMLIGFTYQAKTQKVIINGKEGYRLLAWEDFKGKPDNDSPFGAYTFTNFQAKASGFKFNGDTLVWDAPLEYWVELGRDSWVKKDKRNDTLLQHEQGHFIVGVLLVLELNARVRSTTFLKKDYQLKLNSIIKEVSEKYRAMERQYDKETDHSKNRPLQWKWNEFLAAELNRLRTNSPGE